MPTRREFARVFPEDNKIQEALLRYLGEHGRAKSVDVYEPLAEILGVSAKLLKLTRSEYYVDDPHSGRAWDNLVQWAVRGLRKQEYLLPASAGRGFWCLSPKGEQQVHTK
jgi:hypothetical protein